jgi:hypothetical protein
MEEFSLLLAHQVPAASLAERPELLARALAGAALELIRYYVARNAIHDLPELAERFSYLMLAPVVGSQEAIAAISHSRSDAGAIKREGQAVGTGEVAA